MPHAIFRAGRAIAATALFGAFLSTIPLLDARAEQPAATMLAVKDHGKHMKDHSEARIAELQLASGEHRR